MRDLSRYGIMNLDETAFTHLRASLDIWRDADREQVCDFIKEREGLHDSLEADIMDSLESGSYSFAVEQMRDTEDRYIFPKDLLSWIDDQDEAERWSWYDLECHDSLCQTFWTDHAERKTYREEA